MRTGGGLSRMPAIGSVEGDQLHARRPLGIRRARRAASVGDRMRRRHAGSAPRPMQPDGARRDAPPARRAAGRGRLDARADPGRALASASRAHRDRRPLGPDRRRLGPAGRVPRPASGDPSLDDAARGARARGEAPGAASHRGLPARGARACLGPDPRGRCQSTRPTRRSAAASTDRPARPFAASRAAAGGETVRGPRGHAAARRGAAPRGRP